MPQNPDPLQIQITGRNVVCATVEDRLLLVHAKSICERPEVGERFTDSKLQQIKHACQRYSLGKAQRQVKLVLEKKRIE